MSGKAAASSAFETVRRNALHLLRPTSVQIVVTSAILALALCAATVHAQPIRIPNSEMPGRERERFVDPPAPKSQPGTWLTPPLSQVVPPHPASKRRHGLPAKPKR
jgi:hypothetical protein